MYKPASIYNIMFYAELLRENNNVRKTEKGRKKKLFVNI